MSDRQAPGRTILMLAVVLFPSVSHAGTWVPFGPETYVRTPGPPTTITRSFSILNVNTTYTLRINNGGLQGQLPLSTGSITLNGVQIINQSVLNDQSPITLIERPVSLGLANQLVIKLQGAPGSGIALQVIGVDTDPPVISATISPSPNAVGWNNSNVTVSFSCSDKTSGVAFCPSPVTVSMEGANQVVSGTAIDLAGNTAAASVTINLDKTPPIISGNISPPPDAGGWNSSAVTVSFTCSDALSGVASCSSPVSVTTEGANEAVTGTATDIAGNTATLHLSVNISFNFFYLRNYAGKCLDYGPPWQGSGPTVFLNDCGAAHLIRVAEVGDRMDSQGNVFHHEVLLFAGKDVIGLHNPQIISQGGAPPPPQTEYALELQGYNPILGATANQIFRLDGDSIIWEGHTPCLNTDTNLCPTPQPPQLVVQVQNARGANGSPLVAGLRSLADNEFWDFNALDGSGREPTSGFVRAATNIDLWNAYCRKPAVTSVSGFPGIPIISDPGQPDDGTFLSANMSCSVLNVAWGSVIVVPSGDPSECPPGISPCIDLTYYPPIVLPAGVTLRGNRRSTSFGPQLYATFQNAKESPGVCGWCMLQIGGDYTRITGFRLRGQSRDQNQYSEPTKAIEVHAVPQSQRISTTENTVLIDHNDVSDWEDAGVEVYGAFDDASTQTFDSCQVIVNDPGTLANVTIARNFLHHNERWGLGYGSVMSAGGRALILGNTYEKNRHDIAADGEARDQYWAWYNLVLSDVVSYGFSDCGSFDCIGPQQNFDMHGNGGYGGVGGYGVDIAGNTFLGDNGGAYNFELRGAPCFADYFRDNVTGRQQDSNGGGVINFHKLTSGTAALYLGPDGPSSPVGVAPDPSALIPPSATFLPRPVFDYSNQFGNSSPPFTDPTALLGVGDFDGDGIQDLFLATGVAWYYSPGGQREWRFLSARTETVNQLLFGDFDGDGRTDVVALHGGQLVVSWGGISAFEVLNANPVPCVSIADMAVGDFDGDGRPDIFCADGGTWWISYGGTTPFVQVIVASSLRVQDLRFGDFNGDGTTDVFGIVNGNWSIRIGPKGYQGFLGGWQLLQPALTLPVDGLIVGDFNGDGFADVAMYCGSGCLKISYGGTQGWANYNNLGSFSLVNGGVGRFSGGIGADLLVWNGNEIWVAAGGTGVPYALSSRDMR